MFRSAESWLTRPLRKINKLLTEWCHDMLMCLADPFVAANRLLASRNDHQELLQSMLEAIRFRHTVYDCTSMLQHQELTKKSRFLTTITKHAYESSDGNLCLLCRDIPPRAPEYENSGKQVTTFKRTDTLVLSCGHFYHATCLLQHNMPTLTCLRCMNIGQPISKSLDKGKSRAITPVPETVNYNKRMVESQYMFAALSASRLGTL